jgi:hypothetical protein
MMQQLGVNAAATPPDTVAPPPAVIPPRDARPRRE